METEGILRILGQIAGIGGLAIGLFLLVARSVLKEIPKPEPFSGKDYPKIIKGYKTVIDRIILFAFILSIIGLGIYGLIKYRESYKLAEEKSRLEEIIREITDQNLKSKTAAFEVLELELTFDLTNWKSVPLEKLAIDKLSLQVTKSRRVLWRAAKEARRFVSTYGTRSSFDPVFDCKEYDMKAVLNTDSITPGQDSQKRWILEYNVETAPLFTPFEINTETRAYNSLQNENTEFEGTLIAFATRKALLRVIFPKNKLPLEEPGSIWCETKPFGEKVPYSPVNNPKLKISEDRSIVEWEIDEPRLNYLYLIHWKW
jgi:hypothetical protein